MHINLDYKSQQITQITQIIKSVKSVKSVDKDITLTVDKNGRARFTSTDLDVDFTTTCTTRNGHVTFDHYVLPTSGKYSFIYVRTDDGIHLYSEENAVNTWTFVK